MACYKIIRRIDVIIMKKILITGSSGFIGRNLAEQLSDTYVILQPSSCELDLLIKERVKTYLKENNVDLVIHSANCNNTRKKDVTPYDSLDGNLRMFFNLAAYNHLYEKMYYFGSGAEYDMNSYIPFMQEEYLGIHIPKDPYGFSKYVMSEYSSRSDNIFDLTLFGVFGKYEEWERRFISNAICRALMDLPITIQKNVYYDYLWIDDLVNIMRWFLSHNPRYKHYNVCTGRKIDLYTLACMVRKITNVSCEIVVEKAGLKKEYTGDNSRLLEEIGEYKFADYYKTIETLVDYYGANLASINKSKL